MRYRLPLISFALIAVIAACDKQDPVANGANAVTAVPQPVSDPQPTPAGGPPTNNVSAPAPAGTQNSPPAIPAALQGRWGLTPGDCTSALASAKGLLVVNAGELRFYESRGAPTNDVQSDSLSIGGTFHFTGEGQNWSRYESLKRNGDKLTRTESNPTASYTYAKC